MAYKEVDLHVCAAEPIESVYIADRRAAVQLALDVINDPDFVKTGHRNDNAVNLCIALHVLGFEPEEWLAAWFDKHEEEYLTSDVEAFCEHCYRVIPYLDNWGPRGNEGKALAYAITY